MRSGGGTNAGSIHIENSAVPCLILDIPVRYAHTHFGFSAIEDYKASITLALELIKKLNNNTINEL